MNLSNDQRNVIKGFALYTLANFIIFPLFHWRKGDFNWNDTLLYWVASIVGNLIMTVLFVLGMKIPRK